MRKRKKKFEFSKLILFIFGIIEIGVVIFTCYMVRITCDLSPLAYLIPSTAIVGATGVKHYFNKARTENVIKLKQRYGIPIESHDLTNQEY